MSTDDRKPSRSALKRESEALQTLGERLVALPDEALAGIPMPEELASAVMLARRIRERGGRRRQLQFIGKLMRGLESSEIAAAVDAYDAARREATDAEHRVEEWRDRLLREGPGALSALIRERPDADGEKLDALIRDAAAERAADKPPKAARALFRYLRDELFKN